MVRYIKQTSFKKSDAITASEIGQYCYCPVAWYLQRQGYKPQSPFLEAGIKKHVKLGNIIDYTQVNAKRSKVLATVGHLLLLIAISIIVFEVVL